MPHQRLVSESIRECIQQCLECYSVCQANASLHCLEMGGRHVDPAHFRLMLDCVESCRSAAAMMLNGSDHAAEHCRMCARICRECADSCRALGDMDECVAACERCAESCERMSAQKEPAAKAGKSEHRASH